MPTTPVRHIRIPDTLWNAARTRAAAEHTTITAIIIRALHHHLNDEEGK